MTSAPFFGGRTLLNRIPVFAALILLIGAAGCAGLTARQAVDYNETTLARDMSTNPLARPQSVVMNDKVASLLFDKESRAVFAMDGNRLELDGDIEDKGPGNAASLFKDNNYLYAAWHLKSSRGEHRLLYFRASYDGGKTFSPSRPINSEHGALNYTFASNGKGLLIFAYDDARHGQFEIYYNISYDYGKTWLEKDVRLDKLASGTQSPDEPMLGTFAFEPRVAVNGQSILVLWKERWTGKGGPLYANKARTSLDGGKTWSEEAVVYNEGVYMIFDSPAIHGGSFYAYGCDSEKGVMGFRSVDNGKTWQPLGAVPGTAFKQPEFLKIAGSGDLLYALYLQGGPSDKPNPSIPGLWFSAFSFSENKWNDPVRLDRKEFKEYNITKVSEPALTVLKDGTVVAAWQDYRDIVPNIYMNFSRDKGKTWIERDIAVNEPGKYSSAFPNFLPGKDDMSITYLKYSDYDAKQADYMYRDIRLGKEGAVTGVAAGKGPSSAEKAAKLSKRVEEFWNYRVRADFPEMYRFWDPAYRSKENLETYLGYQGNIIYYSFNIKDVAIKDNVAAVTVGYNFEVKEMEVFGQKVVMPPQDDVLVELWVWIYDNWYKLYKNPLGGQTMKY
jgi:hypothetical protein